MGDQRVLLYGEEILDDKFIGAVRVENPDYPGVIEYVRVEHTAAAAAPDADVA